jgi:hypothetical protein
VSQPQDPVTVHLVPRPGNNTKAENGGGGGGSDRQGSAAGSSADGPSVGLCTLNQVDP